MKKELIFYESSFQIYPAPSLLTVKHQATPLYFSIKYLLFLCRVFGNENENIKYALSVVPLTLNINDIVSTPTTVECPYLWK